MKTSSTFRCLSVFMIGVAGGLLQALAAEEAQPTATVEKLPEVIVNDTAIAKPLEPWLYGKIGPFEIISRGREGETLRFARGLFRLHQAFTALFPKADKIASKPTTVILCNSDKEYSKLMPVLPPGESGLLTNKRVIPERDFSLIVFDLSEVYSDGLTGSSASQDLGYSNPTDDLGQAIDRQDKLSQLYLQLFVSQEQPAPPEWLREGMVRFFSTMVTFQKTISFGRLPHDFVRQMADSSLPSLASMFKPSSDIGESAGMGKFSDQAFLFAHYCLVGQSKRLREPYLRLANRAAHEPVTETMFKEIFGMSYRDMEKSLQSYLSGGVYSKVRANNIELPPIPEFTLRAATEAEVGRCKGDVLRHSGRLEEAYAELMSPVRSHHADARIYASLGRLAIAQQDMKQAALRYEEAVNAGVDLPGPYTFVAQHRLAEIKKLYVDNPGSIETAQVNYVLKPLLPALKLTPLREEIFVIMAKAWNLSVKPAPETTLQMLEDGVRTFPRSGELSYQVAALKLKCGSTTNLTALIEHGLKVAADTDTRNRLEQLKAKLPPAEAPVAK